jgi:hypothetical protein
VKAVLTVDGVSVIDGLPTGKTGAGYVLSAWSVVDVPGWRVSDAQVAKFVFQSPTEGYAAHLKLPGEKPGAISSHGVSGQGMISCSFFEEDTKGESVPGIMISKSGSADSMNRTVCTDSSGASAGAGNMTLATGFGTPVEHLIQTVDFVTRSRPVCVLELQYEESPILRGLGLDVEDRCEAVHPTSGFCVPPVGWRM